MSVTLDIPDDVLASMPVPTAERERFLLLEIACSLYAREVLNLGRAAELAGLSKAEFGQEVGRRGITRHYTQAELDADLAYARGV
jgi:predicted HTH domain antitoxin